MVFLVTEKFPRSYSAPSLGGLGGGGIGLGGGMSGAAYALLYPAGTGLGGKVDAGGRGRGGNVDSRGRGRGGKFDSCDTGRGILVVSRAPGRMAVSFGIGRVASGGT